MGKARMRPDRPARTSLVWRGTRASNSSSPSARVTSRVGCHDETGGLLPPALAQNDKTPAGADGSRMPTDFLACLSQIGRGPAVPESAIHCPGGKNSGSGAAERGCRRVVYWYERKVRQPCPVLPRNRNGAA